MTVNSLPLLFLASPLR